MNKILKVEGMMCENCERKVEDVLLGIDGITYANADHTNGEVALVVDESVNDEQINQAVGCLGFFVSGIF